MTRSEFIALIDYGSDIMFDCNGKSYTILGWYNKGPYIAEQVTEANEASFPNGEALLDGYIIDGKTLSQRFDQIEITFHS